MRFCCEGACHFLPLYTTTLGAPSFDVTMEKMLGTVEGSVRSALMCSSPEEVVSFESRRAARASL